MYADNNDFTIWGNKRYNSLNSYLRRKFGEKVFKIPLDAGFTCPNRDNSLSSDGCAFCSPRGSGDFAADRQLSLKDQFEYGKKMMRKKWVGEKYIAYFQAFSNTYAPVNKLEYLYNLALEQKGVVGLAIATRPDCLPLDVLSLLKEINDRCYLWIELGLQSIHQKTAQLMNLQYDYDTFLKTLDELQKRKIDTCAHLILGLPGEDHNDMLTTAKNIAGLQLQGLKIHLLHLMQGTPLAMTYEKQAFSFLSEDEYVDLVVNILEYLPPQMVIHRLTGDSPRAMLIGPQWSLNKWQVLNRIDRELTTRDTWQGKLYCK